MEFWQSILLHILQNGRAEVVFPQIQDIAALFENECYQTLLNIKAILEDETYTDKECFSKIENSILEFEKYGALNSNRHDFG